MPRKTKRSATGLAAGTQAIQLRGMTFLLAETVHGVVEAQVACHDYAHEGLYTHRIHEGEHRYSIWVAHGRVVKPACCWPRKRSWVEEPRPEPVWQSRTPKTIGDVGLRRLRRLA